MTHLEVTDYIRKVREMREAQRNYFRTRTSIWLQRSKDLEREVDTLTAKYLPTQSQQPQPIQNNLF